ncbi:MAG: hypothetical protein HYZ92_02185 [Candidatus Omnitrophica bacterium]|nr:hypothetical protein [Candidatus Omnitrophota bacterium]
MRRQRASPGAQVKFPYLKDPSGRFAPIVSLRIWAKNRWIYLQAYVDSGASWSILHADIAELLALRVSRMRRQYMALGNGSVIPVSLHRVRVQFAGRELTVPVGFSDALKVGFNLLGRAGFFDRFIMCFNDRDRMLTAIPVGRSAR